MLYRAVIFDLDGTLLDTIEDIADAVNEVLARHNYPVHDIDAFKTMVGLGLDQLIHDALPEEARSSKIIQPVLQEAKQAYGERWNNKSKPYTGIVEMLGALKEKELKVAVLSNKPDRFTQDCVKALLPSSSIDVVWGAIDDFPKKPAPDGALKIANDFGMKSRDILYVGDTRTDMLTAKAAGMFAVGVSWGFRSKKELKENGADVIIDEPMELLGLLK